MKIFSSTSKKYLSEAGYQFESIMRERNDPRSKELRKIKANREKRLNEKKLDNSL